jgi:L-asparaginase
MTEAHLRLLVQEIESGIASGYDGIVVSHGTDTMEETAYLVALTLPRSRVPLALTGAMRHHDAPGADGTANLEDAFAFACRPRGENLLGPVVVMNGEIHSARFVTKRETVNLGAFGSPGAGPVGSVTEGRVSIWFAPSYDDYVGRYPADRWPRVEIVQMTTAMSADSFRALTDTGPEGVVLAGFGGGHAHTSVLGVIDELARRGVAVVAASRCGSGDTLRNTYGVPGTEIDLQSRGVVMAGILSPVKSRLRLAVALANGLPPSSVFPVG